jgi:hypothetical protein
MIHLYRYCDHLVLKNFASGENHLSSLDINPSFGEKFLRGNQIPPYSPKEPFGQGIFRASFRQPSSKNPAGVFQVPVPSTKFLTPQFRELTVSEGLLSTPQTSDDEKERL